MTEPAPTPHNPNPAPAPQPQPNPAPPGPAPAPQPAPQQGQPPQALPQSNLQDLNGFQAAVQFFGLQSDPRFLELTGQPGQPAPAPQPSPAPQPAKVTPEMQAVYDENKRMKEELGKLKTMTQQNQVQAQVLGSMSNARFKDEGAKAMFMQNFLGKYEVTPEGLVKSVATGGIMNKQDNTGQASLADVIQSEVAATPYLFQTQQDWSHPQHQNQAQSQQAAESYFPSQKDIQTPGFVAAVKKSGQYEKLLAGSPINLGAVQAAMG